MIEESGIKIDYHLKLTNSASMTTVLSDFYNEEGDLVTNTADYSIDVVGTIYEPTGVILTNAEGLDYPEMQAITGWHVNIRLPNDNMSTIVDSIYETYGVTPESPSRVWL